MDQKPTEEMLQMDQKPKEMLQMDWKPIEEMFQTDQMITLGMLQMDH